MQPREPDRGFTLANHETQQAWEHHEHQALVHEHDHYHVTHNHNHMAGGFDHLSSEHSHQHDHTALAHAHYPHRDFDQEHRGEAHDHDHGEPVKKRAPKTASSAGQPAAGQAKGAKAAKRVKPAV